MGQLDKQPENSGAGDPQAAEALLRAMTQDIENLRQNLLVQLSQDVDRLQREKFQLIEDIENLKTQHKRQLLQQQQLVQQIAPALVNQLHDLLMQRLAQLADSSRVSDEDAIFSQPEGLSSTREAPLSRLRFNNPKARKSPSGSAANSGLPRNSTASDYNENAHQLIASLDATLRATFRALQQDLKSYQGSLSQQLSQMYTLEQQGEAILEALVSRLKKELQSESSANNNSLLTPPTAPTHPPLPRRDVPGYPQVNHNHNTPTVSYPSVESVPASGVKSEPVPPAAIPQRPSQPLKGSKLQIGFLLVVISCLTLSFQNVAIAIILNKSKLFGVFELGGFIAPSLGNALLLLWLRMLIVVPLMAILATVIHPSAWRDIKRFAQSNDWSSFLTVLSSGFFLFLSQVLIYMALGQVAPGIAITIFFIYPILVVLLAWFLFGAQPSLVRSLIIFSVLLGSVLLTLTSGRGDGLSSDGVSNAIGSAIAFAIHIILAQTCAKKLNPIPLSWINFVIILTFCGISLAGPFPESWHFNVEPTMWPPLIISSLLLGGTTLLIYLLDNISIRMVSAAKASILGATVPLLTALLALVLIQSTLQLQQIFGLLLVTLGVAALRSVRSSRKPKTT